MKKNFLKRFAAVATAAVMAISLLPGAALAAKTTSTIDTTIKGSITLTKMDDAQSPAAPIADVGYTIYKIATIGQDASGIVYESAMKDSSNATIEVPAISSNAQAEALYAQLKDGNLSTLFSQTETTDSNGVAAFTGLDLGVYLVYESTKPAGVASGQSFIVSVPSTVDVANDGNIEWDYDIVATPKNTVTEINIDKVINEGNGVKAGDYEIGDQVPYKITADVPANVAELTTYKIEDTLSAGLTYDANTVAVYGVRADGQADDLLVDPTNYGFTHAAQVSTIDFVVNGLTYTDVNTGDTKTYEKVIVTYTATLNKDAAVGTGNANEVDLIYSTSNKTTTVEPDIDPKAYTYAIEVTKQGENSSVLLAGVEFELRDANDVAIKVSEVTSGVDGVYVFDNNGSVTVKTDANGKLKITGLADGTYKLVETKTNTGYTLLKEAIEFTITTTVVGNTVTTTCVAKDGTNYTITNGVIGITVVNKKGFDLPNTGGMGTYIFTIGGVIILLAAVVLLSKKRKAN